MDKHSQEFSSPPLGQFLKLNKALKLRALVELALAIEDNWQQPLKRQNLYEVFRGYLSALKEEADGDLLEISRLEQKLDIPKGLKHFLSITVPIERRYARSIRDDEYLILSQDKPSRQAKPMPLYLIADNIRSAFNIGSIFRTSECLGISKIYLCGYTATPENHKIEQTAMGTDSLVPWEWHSRSKEVISLLKSHDIPVLALETVVEGKTLYEVDFPRPCALLLGNERYGLEADLLALCNEIVRIPLSGRKNSLNVGVAFGVVGYEIRRQWHSIAKLSS